MERDIKFRGKAIENGVWVYGAYYEHQPPLQCIGKSKEKSRHFIIKTDFADWGMPRQAVFDQVDPETVGQFIGLKDSKRTEEYPEGQEIYDNDILHNEEVLNYPVSIIFDKELSAYMIHTQSDFLGNAVYKYQLKVIGNAHDNPELLQGTQL